MGGFWTLLWLNDVAARKNGDTWGSSELGKGQPRFINPRPSLTISSPYKRRGQQWICSLVPNKHANQKHPKSLFESKVYPCWFMLCDSLWVKLPLRRLGIWSRSSTSDHAPVRIERSEDVGRKMMQIPSRNIQNLVFYSVLPWNFK